LINLKLILILLVLLKFKP